jgi:signal transduction histidine kinase
VCCAGQELQVVVRDQGAGLPREMVLLLDQIAAGAAPWPEGKGLGLWTTGHAVRRLGGHIEVQYPGIGTRVVVTFPIAVQEILHVAA